MTAPDAATHPTAPAAGTARLAPPAPDPDRLPALGRTTRTAPTAPHHATPHHLPTRSSPVKTFACGDVIPGCSARLSAVDEGGILAQVAGHAAADHGVTDITLELVQAVRDRIRTV